MGQAMKSMLLGGSIAATAFACHLNIDTDSSGARADASDSTPIPGNCSIISVLGPDGVQHGCDSCTLATCKSSLDGVTSACSDLLSCVCPGGTYDLSLDESCSSRRTPACTSAGQALTTCLMNSSCMIPCGTGSSSGGSSDSGSSGGSSSSSGGATE